MLSMFKIYILVAIVGLVGGVVYGGYYYYKDTQARIQTLTENSVKLEQAAQTQKETIDILIADAERFAKLNSELQEKLVNANNYKNELIGKLRNHDLTRLSQQRPGLIERRINDGTQELLESFESITAVPAIE
ncbi:hypothetical protein CMI47_09965 [Candidatus Pacearchaeota archaeon]|nr:hypothetical protein [Candidatus Pacearchaeota archaeon]|tara:strand:- start:5827 stop:6225 length:399 start_codon:yes stop_codon:yes gene_type:complete